VKRRTVATLLGLVALAACNAPPQPYEGSPATWSASLPPGSVEGAGDPARAALIRSAWAFNTPGALANNPAAAARVIADMEYLAIELAGPRWVMLRLAAVQLQGARPEWRTALGIAPATPPQPLIDALYGARRALLAGDQAGAAAMLPPALFSPGGAGTLQVLANLPPLPQTAAAASLAEREATRAAFDQSRRRGLR